MLPGGTGLLLSSLTWWLGDADGKNLNMSARPGVSPRLSVTLAAMAN